MKLLKYQPQMTATPKLNYNNARRQILVAVIFTVINIALVIAKDASSYFLFSLYVPYSIFASAGFYCGMFSQEYYNEQYGAGAELEFFPQSLFIVAAIITFIIIALYVVCYFLSKKHIGWMITTLVLVSIDTLFLLYDMLSSGAILSYILDIIFHALILFYAILAVKCYFTQKNTPLAQDDSYTQAQEAGYMSEINSETQGSEASGYVFSSDNFSYNENPKSSENSDNSENCGESNTDI